jgi:hypothetical protein
MSRASGRQSDAVSRRKYLLTSAAIGAAGLAGCSGNSDDSSDGGDGGSGGEDGSNTMESGSSAPATVTAEGSSTVYPISNKGSSYWNSNSPASDGDYCGSNDESSVSGGDEIQTDMNIADYFARLYGFEPSGERSNPPFATRVALSHSGTGCEAVRDGLVDIGNSSGPITAELDELGLSRPRLFTYYAIAHRLETAADQVVRIAIAGENLPEPLPDSVAADVRSVAADVAGAVDDAVTAVIDGDVTTAQSASDQCDDAIEGIEDVERRLYDESVSVSVPAAVALSNALSQLQRGTDCGRNLADIAARTAIRAENIGT